MGVEVEDKRSGSGSVRSLLFPMLLGGALMGTVFPLVASLFVEPKSGAALAGFWAVAIVAGLVVGYFCFRISDKVAHDLLADVLDEVANRLGVEGSAQKGTAQTRRALLDAVDRASGLLRRVQSVNQDIRSLTAQVLAATEEQASGAAEQAAAVSDRKSVV